MELDFDVKLTIEILEERIHSLEMRVKENERFQSITHHQYQANVVNKNQIEELNKTIEELIKIKDNAYSERNKCIAALANFIRDTAHPHYRVYVTYHPEEDESWEDDWRTILVIERNELQMTWHFHDSEKYLLERLPTRDLYKWDGHNTEEKYKRLMKLFIE